MGSISQYKILFLKNDLFLFQKKKFQSLTSFEPNGEEPRLSDLEQKDKVLLLSTPPDTFRGFSYISPNAVTSF